MWSALFLKGWLGKCSDLAEGQGPIQFFFLSFLNKGPVSRVFFSYGMFSIRIHFCFCKISQIIHAWLLSNKLFLFFFSIYGAGGPSAGTLILYHSPTGLKVEMLNTGPFVMVRSLFPDFFFFPLFLWEPLLSVSDWESVASLGTLRSAVRNKYCDRYHLSRTLDQVAVTFYQDETLMSFSVSQINHSILISETTECRRLQSSVSTSGIPSRNVEKKAATKRTRHSLDI